RHAGRALPDRGAAERVHVGADGRRGRTGREAAAPGGGARPRVRRPRDPSHRAHPQHRPGDRRGGGAAPVGAHRAGRSRPRQARPARLRAAGRLRAAKRPLPRDGGGGAGAHLMFTVQRAFAVVFLLLGAALLVESVVVGAGTFGYLIAVIFLALGI